MKKLSSLIILSVLWACGSTPKAEEKVVDETSTNCYGSYTDKDSVFLSLTVAGEKVTGNLIYKLFEKDKNHGTLEGVVHGDTILATYQVVSEGKTSAREVAFLRKDNSLVEGFAPMDSTGTHFQNKDEIDFTGIILASDECHE